jgi:hypothetical protein
VCDEKQTRRGFCVEAPGGSGAVRADSPLAIELRRLQRVVY